MPASFPRRRCRTGPGPPPRHVVDTRTQGPPAGQAADSRGPCHGRRPGGHSRDLGNSFLPLPEIAGAPVCFIDRLPGRQFVQPGDHRRGVCVGYSGLVVKLLFDVVQAVSRTVVGEHVAANRRLAKLAYLQTIVVHHLPRAPLRISPLEGTQRFWRTQNPPTPHLQGRLSPTAFRCTSLVLNTPGDPTPLPIKPIAAYTDRQTHTKNEKDAQFIRDDSRSSLLANAWYSTHELAACLRVDTSTLPVGAPPGRPRARRSSPFRNASWCTARSTLRNGCVAAGPSRAETHDGRESRLAGRCPTHNRHRVSA